MLLLIFFIRLFFSVTIVQPAADAGEPTKKAAWLADKTERAQVHRATLPHGLAAQPALTLRNLWIDEVSPVVNGQLPAPAIFDLLLRCHYTQQHIHMAPRLYTIVLAAAHRFSATTVELVSGYRSPKYQLTLRKKGHEVARDSEHPRGEAVDFRLPGVPTRLLYRFVRTLRAGGVGYYPVSGFVHADVGRIRTWRGH